MPEKLKLSLDDLRVETFETTVPAEGRAGTVHALDCEYTDPDCSRCSLATTCYACSDGTGCSDCTACTNCTQMSTCVDTCYHSFPYTTDNCQTLTYY
jgi:hypothetical protein